MVKGSVQTNNGDTQGQLAAEGVGIARVCIETVEHQIKAGLLIPVLEAFNPGDGEEIHAVFVGGTNTPVRVRCFVDYLMEQFERGDLGLDTQIDERPLSHERRHLRSSALIDWVESATVVWCWPTPSTEDSVSMRPETSPSKNSLTVLTAALRT